MIIPILATKLLVPPLRPGYVSRPRLLAQLDAGLSRRLTLLSAGAGAGKSTLLSEWLRHLRAADEPPAIAWISLDAGDNDLTRFLSYLVAALDGSDALRSLLNARQPIEAAALLTLLINELADRPGRTILALDDYQAITSQTAHDAVALLIERQPPGLHLVIATRIDPPLPLARLRASDAVAEVRGADLRFSPDEAREFLGRVLGAPLSDAEIAGLNAVVEGWAVGLQLAGLSLRGRSPEAAQRFIAGFSGRQHFVFDYLADEVLARQPDEEQAFLLRTAVPERLCAALAAALAGDEPSAPSCQAMLERLEHRNLFLIPLDDAQQWYRYHNLFRDLLLARLLEGGPERLAELHRRAARWFTGNDYVPEAVTHGLAAGDHEFVAATLEQWAARTTAWTGLSYAVFLGWLEALPPEVLRSRWMLRLFASRMTYVRGDTRQARAALDALEADARVAADTPVVRQILAAVPADRASYALFEGRLRAAIEFGHGLLAAAAPEDHIGRARAHALTGMAQLRAGDVVAADAAFARAVVEADASPVPTLSVVFLASQAESRLLQGRLRDAEALNREALARGVTGEAPLPVAGFSHLGLAKILYERNDVPAARAAAETGARLLGQGGITEAFGNGHGTLALIRQAEGDEAGAARDAELAVQLARASALPRSITEAGAYRARVLLAQREIARAAEWIGELAAVDAGETLREFEELTVARIMLAQDEVRPALALLRRLRAAAEAAARFGRVLEADMLRCLALDALGERPAALALLRSTLAAAEPEGYTRLFLDAGPAMAALLRLAARGDDPQARAAAQRLLPQVLPQQGAPGQSPAAAVQPRAALVDEPSERELEVLRLLPGELSIPEIAARLGVAPSTIRTHVKHLYEILGAHSRFEAVQRARERGLL